MKTNLPSSSIFCVVLLCSGTIARLISSEPCVHSEGPRSLMHEKEEDVSTLDEWKVVLVKDFLELQRLEGQDASTRERHSLTEQAIGRPSIDAVVFFKLQLVMFFEGIRSERQLMRHAADRLSVLWYIGYDLGEPLPDHSSLTRIRERYGVEVFHRFFDTIVEQ